MRGVTSFDKIVVRSTDALWQTQAAPTVLGELGETLTEVQRAAETLEGIVLDWKVWLFESGRRIAALPDYGDGASVDTPPLTIDGMGQAMLLQQQATVAVRTLYGHRCLPPSLQGRSLNEALSLFPSCPQGAISSERDKLFVDAVRQAIPSLLALRRELQEMLDQLKYAPRSVPALYAPVTVAEEGKRAATTKPQRSRGRPAGSDTADRDLQLYKAWKTAHQATGITKAEFLREKGLPESDLSAIERGRARAKPRRRPGRK
jgi:hypothetical protein